MANITFYGLGNMGQGMALNLLKNKHCLSVFDLVPNNMAPLIEAGAKGANSAKEAAQQADVIISMLPAGHHVAALYDEIIGSVNSNTLFIDCSTIEASTARALKDKVCSQGHRFVDAPVSGGVAGAKAGTLTFIMGGDDTDVQKAKHILEGMGKHCFHAGKAGAGQVAKICNNMLLAVLMTGTCEALQMGIDNGLDPKVMSDIMQQSSGNNWVLQVYNPVPNIMPNAPSSNNYKGGFMVDLMNKDLRLAMQTALEHQSTTPMGALAKSLFELHAKGGNGGKDFSSIFESFK
ncbi:3-hydroxyisobutyrate dehydrogenase [Glaciecola sp. 2405UD65-10]|uniref:3-hydroxyisobutyrate dehydrogenase n=1 Tax=Glaciecola sp. 2405UD65-10 TaxID=3397244 RepID=UPI003B590D16